MYFVDFRASEDGTGDADSEAGLDWTLESDGDYDAGQSPAAPALQCH